jgi:hypothetical protein
VSTVASRSTASRIVFIAEFMYVFSSWQNHTKLANGIT